MPAMPCVSSIAVGLLAILLLVPIAVSGVTFSPNASSAYDPDVRSFHSIDNASRALYAGQNALQSGRYDEALAQYTIATEEDPSWAAAWYLRAYSLVKLNRSQEALSSVDRALLLDPSDRDANELKAEILEGMGLTSEAAAFRRAAAASIASPAATALPASPTAKAPLSQIAGLAGLLVAAVLGRGRARR